MMPVFETERTDAKRAFARAIADQVGPDYDRAVKLFSEPVCRQLGIYPIPADFKLSVVIPVFNEKNWVREIVRRVRAVPIPKEIIIVDDCSTDGTRDILRELEGDGVQVHYQPHNQGKGAALR